MTANIPYKNQPSSLENDINSEKKKKKIAPFHNNDNNYNNNKI